MYVTKLRYIETITSSIKDTLGSLTNAKTILEPPLPMCLDIYYHIIFFIDIGSKHRPKNSHLDEVKKKLTEKLLRVLTSKNIQISGANKLCKMFYYILK